MKVTLLIVKPITITTMRRNDKIKHAVAGFLIAFAISVPCYCSSYDLFAGLWACLSGIVAGAVKEWCDMHTEGREWDWKDFGSTAVGTVIAMLFVICLHYGRG